MAAPGKKGLDYFSFSVDLLNDPKLRRPKMQYGYLAPMVYISLLSLLYRDKGYYIDYSDKDAIIWYVLGDLQGKYCPSPETVAEVIAALVACGLFSDDLFQREIISSKRAQRTFYSATATRKTVDIDGGIWLLTDADMAELSVKHCYYLKTHNQSINPANQSINEVNQSINKQRRVEKSKVNKSTTTTTSSKLESGSQHESQIPLLLSSEEIEARQKKYGAAIGQWEDVMGKLLTNFELESVCALVDEYGGQWVIDAMRVTGEAGKSSLRFVKGVLNNWKTEGREAKKPVSESNADRWAQIEQMAEAKRGAGKEVQRFGGK